MRQKGENIQHDFTRRSFALVIVNYAVHSKLGPQRLAQLEYTNVHRLCVDITEILLHERKF